MKTQFILLDTPESLETVRKIASSVWPETFHSILSPEQIKYMMNMMYAPDVMEKELSDGYRFEALLVEGAPAGYISYSEYKNHPSTAKLHKVYLLSEYHSRGLGQLMLDHAQKQCRALGCKNILLTVNKQNTRAVKAYLKNGFEKTDSVKTPIGSGFFMDDFIMQKSL